MPIPTHYVIAQNGIHQYTITVNITRVERNNGGLIAYNIASYVINHSNRLITLREVLNVIERELGYGNGYIFRNYNVTTSMIKPIGNILNDESYVHLIAMVNAIMLNVVFIDR